MGTYVIRRLILAVLVLFLVTVITFMLIQIMPGDPARIMLGQDVEEEEVEALRKELLLDRSVPVQYAHWLRNALKGDFGDSIAYQVSVISLIAQRLPVTLYLGLISTLISIVLGIGAGVFCAVKRGTHSDNIITLFANIGIAVPIFWIGILGVYFFGLKLSWLPIQGYTSPFDDFVLSTRKLIMPVLCMAIPGITVLTRQTRSAMLEVIKTDYIRTAWSKGLNERIILTRHALKNGLMTIVTLLGLHLRIVVGGSVIIETVFNIPGMGTLMVSSVFNKDFILVQACTLWMAIVVLFANLIVDISYGWIDPRVKYN